MINALRDRWAAIPRWGQLTLVILIVIFVPPLITVVERSTGFGLLTQVNRALIYVCLALGLNIVVGFAGLLDLGYAAFFAIGAYAFGVLTWPNLRIEASFFLAIWGCAAVAAAFGLLIGAPTLRLRGDYLAIVTPRFWRNHPQAGPQFRRYYHPHRQLDPGREFQSDQRAAGHESARQAQFQLHRVDPQPCA
ncbi:MAG: hypothetical protein IPK52_14240 [Chloroflexi bacterium]|nr:hypothetical protein [Chloroflexota bacterium]